MQRREECTLVRADPAGEQETIGFRLEPQMVQTSVEDRRRRDRAHVGERATRSHQTRQTPE